VMKAKDFRQQQHIIDQTVGIGTIPPDIILPSSTGDTVRLSSLRGKVVLLDFWASWCKPCREAHPSMVKTYWRYRARGFEIFQVSLDQDREAWISAIRDDRLSGWLHGSDLKYWNSPAARRYYVSSLPSSFLLDRDGRILAKNLKGEDLEKKLSEIFEH
jgi:peroxiredoxin